MSYHEIMKVLKAMPGVDAVSEPYPDEIRVIVKPENLRMAGMYLHERLRSPVMAFFAEDDRSQSRNFLLHCVFLDAESGKWFILQTAVPEDRPQFDSFAPDVYSASLFEREIKEMFGIEPTGNPDLRRLRLHDEVWPDGYFPLRKDFKAPDKACVSEKEYVFDRVEGDGIFEVPVGPVHAGIIGPGHFRFSVAGEPIINLEARLGFTHRGVEKLFEGMAVDEALRLSECISGDAAFAYSTAFCMAVEKIRGIQVSEQAQALRAIYMELERMYNHAADMGGIAIDVGFSFPAAYAQAIKEKILKVNAKLTAGRYLKNTNIIGGVRNLPGQDDGRFLTGFLTEVLSDFYALKKMLTESVSFMERVDGTGILKKKTAEDLGITGLAGRASGIGIDLRQAFPGIYGKVRFNLRKKEAGDALARLCMRMEEFEDSVWMIDQLIHNMDGMTQDKPAIAGPVKDGIALGYAEAWRGPVLFWVRMDKDGRIERCKVVDASFRNWQGLCFAVLGDIIPDFPLCNKSFDLSYSGTDL